MTKIVAIDIETDMIKNILGKAVVTKIWCIVCIDVDTKVKDIFYNPTSIPEERERFKKYVSTVDRWVGHNAVGFDIPNTNSLLGTSIPTSSVVDTMVASRLVNFNNGFGGHSLEAWGTHLGYPKIDFHDYSKLTEEMVEYCVRDVEVTIKVYERLKKYIMDPEWAKAMRIEHDMIGICQDMKGNGFKFKAEEAREILKEVKGRMSGLEGEFQECFPPELLPTHEIQYRVKLDGTLYDTTAKAIDKYPKTEVVGDMLVCYTYVLFDPSSPKKRIDRLWDAGWDPYEKTKGHNKFLREVRIGKISDPEVIAKKDENFSRYGWTCGEDNLATLPQGAPEGAHKLAEWLTLEGRRSSIVEWLNSTQEDGRIHGTFLHIGSWTGRMSHSAPNQANIFSPFHGEPRSAVEEVKAAYDSKLRALWCVDEGVHLVGTDAEGIQLRILAHLLKNDEYVHAIVSGRKEDETDIHNLNKQALGGVCRSRDDSKTFIYAFLLGAGIPKIASILGTNNGRAGSAMQDFYSNINGLGKLKKTRIPREARRGYFQGVDGRKVACRSEHLMLAGHLQNGESVVMKHATRVWKEQADKEKINYKLIDLVHDEWQTEVHGSMDMTERLGEIQQQSLVTVGETLDLYCPLAGSTDVGVNWLETH